MCVRWCASSGILGGDFGNSVYALSVWPVKRGFTRGEYFSRAEIEYLRTLPSIDAVTDSRITYAREFQIDCMRRYLQGEKPTAIFISAGLSPSVIGHKRIERNIARWKRDEDIMRKAAEEPEPHDTAVDSHNAMSEVPLGKIQSLACQVMVLSDRVDKLERLVEGLRKGDKI